MNELERFKTICETIAFLHPDMPMSEALPLANQVEEAAKGRLLPTTFKELVDLARRSAAVTDFLPHKKINAIKELRVIFRDLALETHGVATWDELPDKVRDLGGLKACKDAVEAIMPRPPY